MVPLWKGQHNGVFDKIQRLCNAVPTVPSTLFHIALVITDSVGIRVQTGSIDVHVAFFVVNAVEAVVEALGRVTLWITVATPERSHALIITHMDTADSCKRQGAKLC